MARRGKAGTALLLGGAAAVVAAAVALAQPPSALAQALDPGRAGLEARVLELEEEIRRLNGKVEELEYRQERLTGRLEGLVGAVDERLSAVEPGPAPATPPRLVGSDDGSGGYGADEAPPPPVAPAEPAAPATPGGGGVPRRLTPATPPPPPARATARAPDVEPDASAARGYVLGTIPRDAARGGAPAQGGAAGGTIAALPPAAAGEAAGYEGALDLLQRGRWPEAEQAFKAFLDANPEDPRASSAAYWLAETYYFRKEYGDAAAAFARNYRGYGPEAPKAADNLLKLGMSLAALGQKDNACQTFAELAKRHPNASVPVRQTLARERSAAACA